ERSAPVEKVFLLRLLFIQGVPGQRLQPVDDNFERKDLTVSAHLRQPRSDLLRGELRRPGRRSEDLLVEFVADLRQREARLSDVLLGPVKIILDQVAERPAGLSGEVPKVDETLTV